MKNRYVLNLACKDISGISYAINQFVFENGGFIHEAASFGDVHTERFFARTDFSIDAEINTLQKKFIPIAEKFQMDYKIISKKYRPKIIILVTKESHCLAHLLHKYQTNALNAEIIAIISNHDSMRFMADNAGIPYHYLPIKKDDADSKKEQEEKIWQIFQDHECDLVVLARYMQVLSPDLSEKLDGRAINIHHSFLPSFKGARPYKQAYDKGVKIIGATSHFVTTDLDEGPIIEQEVVRVNHKDTPSDLELAGQDVENRVLFRAVRWFCEHRIIANGNKTVIFS